MAIRNIAAGDKMTRLLAVYQVSQDEVVVFTAYSAVGPIILNPSNEPLPNNSLKDATTTKMME